MSYCSIPGSLSDWKPLQGKSIPAQDFACTCGKKAGSQALGACLAPPGSLGSLSWSTVRFTPVKGRGFTGGAQATALQPCRSLRFPPPGSDGALLAGVTEKRWVLASGTTPLPSLPGPPGAVSRGERKSISETRQLSESDVTGSCL